MSNPEMHQAHNPFSQALQANNQNLPWLILAGGRATRMGGVDKGLVKLGAHPLIMHSMTILRAQGAAVVINANRNISDYQAMAPCICDQHIGQEIQFDGPLAALLQVLLNYRMIKSGWALAPAIALICRKI